MLIDTHFHFSKENYNEEEINEVLNKCEEFKVGKLIVCGCSKNEIVDILERYKENDNIYFSLGFHPEFAADITDDDLLWLEELLKNKRVVAVGEIGLDYHYTKENKDKQIYLFKKQIELAEKYNLPVVIHSRDSIGETYDILKQYKVRGVIHCFSGSLEMANNFINLGFYLGIGGVVTFKNSNLGEVIKKIGIDHIVLETDSPYLSPEPFRGKKNGPYNVYYVAKHLENILFISFNDISKITTKNAIMLFDLDN